MTRFARAKGSKASNERAPEDATPWAVMKEQLQRAKEDAEHAKLQKQAEEQRLENYEKFLHERKTAKRKSTWCEFPDDQTGSTAKNIPKRNLYQDKETNDKSDTAQIIPVKKKKKPKKSHDKSATNGEINQDQQVSQDLITNNEEIECSKIKKKNKKTHKLDKDHIIELGSNIEESLKKKKQKNKDDIEETSISNKEDIEPLKKKKKKHNKTQGNDKNNTMQKEGGASTVENKEPNKLPKKKNKRDGPKIRRKPETDHSFQIIINGREVDLVRFEGFPVMKKDADRLQQLRKDMTTKGIPKREIDRTMKLERRRAEKALARVKRDVCYNCRKGGHNISSCPDLRSLLPDRETDAIDPAAQQVEMADGICFKCGSTEHRQSECRVQKGQQFRFASCFICKEQGHIARQCPDNPKGLYPNGGGCKICGDVTHLRKDCPTTTTSKEESSVRLDMLVSSENVEDIPHNNASSQPSSVSKKPKKIKF